MRLMSNLLIVFCLSNCARSERLRRTMLAGGVPQPTHGTRGVGGGGEKVTFSLMCACRACLLASVKTSVTGLARTAL